MAWNPVEKFGQLLQGEEFALEEGALCIAACGCPDMDLDAELEKLDALADLCDGASRERVLLSLFGDLGFHGNREDYYDPRNSFLNEVVRRRTGIPISLAVLTIAIGERVGCEFEGIGLPGHFMIRDRNEPDVFIDVFAGGALLDVRGCQELFRRVNGEGNGFHPAYLAPVGHSSIMERMLGNLRAVYIQQRDYANLEWVLEMRTMCPSATPEEVKHLGMVNLERGRFDEAARRFEELAAAAENGDGGQLQRLAALARSRMN
ncbi:MAG: transglutaminase-like domain-containing protein [bacterium]|nr:transglutaminase-like domain-containing protein [bacterium]MCY4195037.1 transglutaminase-like domain-containing protein [bacterium]